MIMFMSQSFINDTYSSHSRLLLMQCSFQLAQVSLERTSNGIHFFHSIYCSYTHVQKNIPAASLQEHSEFFSLWLHQLAPSFLAFLCVTTLTTANCHSSESHNDQGWKGPLRSSSPASPSMPVHADIPSDPSLRLTPHLAHYIHTLRGKTGVCEEFWKFLCLALLSRSTVSYSHLRYFHSLAVQRLPQLHFSPGQRAGDWHSTAVATRCGGNGDGGDGSGGNWGGAPWHGVRAFLWLCQGCSYLNTTP